MISRRVPQPLALDPESVLRAAAEILEREPRITDAAVLALAHLRSSGELARRTKPWSRVWQQIPASLPADAPETDELVRLAIEWGDAEVALLRAERAPVDRKALEPHRQRGVALKRAVFDEVDAMALEQYAAAQAQADHEDVIRVARGAAAAAERAAEDQLRLCSAAAKNGRRP